MTIAETVTDIDKVKNALTELREDLNERLALVINAADEIRQVRSDIISELGNSPSDAYLKARFVSGLDEAVASLKRAQS